MAAITDPNGTFEVDLHVAEGVDFTLTPPQSAELLARLQTAIRDDNITKWAPKWQAGGYDGVEVRCNNPRGAVPAALRKFGRFGGRVKLTVYDDYITVYRRGGATSYKDPTGVEAFLFAAGHANKPESIAAEWRAVVLQVVKYRKDPDAPL